MRPMKLFDRADGVRGHYCIGRMVGDEGKRYWQYYNRGEWESAGEVFTDKEAAERKLVEIRAALALTESSTKPKE